MGLLVSPVAIGSRSSVFVLELVQNQDIMRMIGVDGVLRWLVEVAVCIVLT